MKKFMAGARERRLAVIAGVLIGGWALLTWFLQPLWNQVSELRGQAQSQQEKLDAVSRLMDEAASIEQQYAAAGSFLAATDEAQSQQTLLGEMESLSRTAGVQLNLKPKPGTRGEDKISRFEIELEVQGPQAQVFGFLDSLFALPRLFTVRRLRIAGIPAESASLRATLVVQGIVLPH